MRASVRTFSRLIVPLFSLLTISACNDQSADQFTSAEAPAPYVEADMSVKAARGEPREAEPSGAMLAYSYSMGVMAPKNSVAPLLETHQQACVDAGPDLCQVLGSSINMRGEDFVYGNLNLRAAPQWLETFRGNIVTDAESVGGKLVSNEVYAEDLTQYITDVEARLEAKIALRDRIRTMLEEREGDLSDVLAAERALAEVQGEIDSMTASLEIARRRVAMSSLSISYSTDPVTSTGIFKPLGEAFSEFGRTSVQSLAEAVRFVARSWPFFIVLLIALAILRAWWRGRHRAKAK